jgi:hypothetical protein
VAALFLAMLAAGLASGVHCAGMCGGIVVAFNGNSIFPVKIVSNWEKNFLFNAGRISTYAAAGAVAGALGGAAYAAGAIPVQEVLFIAVNILLVLIGLQLAGLGGPLARLEALGAPLWRRVQPIAARLLPARSLPRAYAAGLAWGWLPCGLVYSALAAAALSGSASRGAVAMLAFGIGTLPYLLAAGWIGARLRAWRRAAAGVLLAFGVLGLASAGGLAEGVRRGLLCL